jgi:fructosamine-3-kinase
VSGGDISDAYRLSGKGGDFFFKVNHRSDAERMFKVEADSLQLLGSGGAIRTPAVIWTGSLDSGAGLLLEFIENRLPTSEDLLRFGRSLAQMHQQSSADFGWHQNNYIGSLEQYNTPHATWPEFYGRERLLPQIKMARQKNLLSAGEIPTEDRLLNSLKQYLPDTSPGLLHGDLWGGNYLISTKGQACLIDPAVYYGHGEVDLAMSRLFGGFGPAFYQGYHEVLPPEAGFAERQDIYQLYYLLVHLNLFGSSYYGSVSRILQRYF